MLIQEKPKEYVLSSNETHTIAAFVELAFKHAKIEGEWIGDLQNRKYVIPKNVLNASNIKSDILMQIDSQFYRPAEVDLLLGDSTPAREELGWQPETSFQKLVEKMVDNDLRS
jgi:GDPmannose 4,6-dehydratase